MSVWEWRSSCASLAVTANLYRWTVTPMISFPRAAGSIIVVCHRQFPFMSSPAEPRIRQLRRQLTAAFLLASFSDFVCLPSTVGQHDNCTISITNANETRDPNGEHKFKVRVLYSFCPANFRTHLASADDSQLWIPTAGQLVLGHEPA